MKKNIPHNEAWWALVVQGVGLILAAPLAWFLKDMFVAGSAIFGAKNDSDANVYNTVVGQMRAELAKAKI